VECFVVFCSILGGDLYKLERSLNCWDLNLLEDGLQQDRAPRSPNMYLSLLLIYNINRLEITTIVLSFSTNPKYRLLSPSLKYSLYWPRWVLVVVVVVLDARK
jgi:hypothetical protein